ncbi:MAG TPA: 2-dehydropantoate 2-reductase [Rhizomicrobium sp.]|jgi:2-dehydropantoate 2-reductase|nr:2-dehydropantoate 2-reductase [Rhizomicrobium sp.]
MRIGIVSAGAIGGLLGVPLARAGHEVSVLARGATLDALRTGNWTMERGGTAIAATVRASDNAAELGMQDVILIAVKGPALAGAADALQPMIGPETIVVPAMNGVPWWFLLEGGGSLGPTGLRSVDPDGQIARAIPSRHVFGCVVHASAYVSAPGRVVHQAGNTLIFGEPAGGQSGRVSLIAEVFTTAAFEIIQSDNVRRDIWYKLWGNMTMNPISAMVRATSDKVLEDDLVRAFMLRVMAEAKEIGRHIGCEIDESGEARMEVARKLGSFKTSMLQDAEAGRPLEIDSIVAAPYEIARLLGLETPFLGTLLGLSRLYARSLAR